MNDNASIEIFAVLFISGENDTSNLYKEWPSIILIYHMNTRLNNWYNARAVRLSVQAHTNKVLKIFAFTPVLGSHFL